MKALIYMEIKDGAPLNGSLELISAAASLNAEADVILIGSDPEAAADYAAKAGGAKVHTISVGSPISEDVLVDALVQAAQKEDYGLVLASATVTAKSFMSRVAARLDAAYVSDVTEIEAVSDGYIFTRPAFGGTVFEKRHTKGAMAVAAVRAGSYDKPEASDGTASVEASDIVIDESAIRTKIVNIIAETTKSVDIESAKIIVVAGRGVGTEADFPLVQELADALGGVVGGSRPLVDEGMIPRQQQVGQSGKIVTPDLYIGLAVSGAPQHIAGMSGSKFIVAVNRDKDAPIFNVADLGIVADAKKILPLLIEAVKEYRS